LEFIEQETENARNGQPARIFAKINSLIEPQVIQALYQASQAGVKIDLVVRGICSLRPGIKGVSENIRVRSIIGRFLEHTRVFYFENGGEERLYLSSADWMGRNFFDRVETCFPIENEPIKKRIMRECRSYLADNCQAWTLQSDGSYRRLTAPRDKRKSAQEALLRELAGD
jgi:polyphosphate kinase